MVVRSQRFRAHLRKIAIGVLLAILMGPPLLAILKVAHQKVTVSPASWTRTQWEAPENISLSPGIVDLPPFQLNAIF